MIEVASFSDATIADMARGRLAAEGIDVVLLGAGVASLGLGLIAPARLMVDPSQKARAEFILASIMPND